MLLLRLYFYSYISIKQMFIVIFKCVELNVHLCEMIMNICL